MSRRDRPLKILEFFLKNVIPYEDQENLAGDFEEIYERIFGKSGKATALLWYAFQIIKLVPSYFKNYTYWSLAMIKNYLITALRNIRRHKVYSFINITGLALGISCSLLLILYVQHEMSFDSFHKKADRIYRIIRKQPGLKFGGKEFAAQTPGPLAQTLKQEYPEVIQATKIGLYYTELLITHEDRSFYEKGISADENFFEVFSFQLLKGNPKTALAEPSTIVLTERLAEKYFGTEDPLGKTIKIEEDQDVKITGIVKQMPKNSHLRFDYIMSLISLKLIQGESNYLVLWDAPNNFQTYIELQKDADHKELEKKLPAFARRYVGDLERNQKRQMESYHLQPLRNIHLDSNVNDSISVNSNKSNIYVFSIIAFAILLIACINYMNLTTARASKRSKEIGIRKVVGALRKQLIKQFIFESFILTFAAFSLAVLIVMFIWPLFNSFIDRDITINILNNSNIILGFISLLLLTGLSSGLYPSLVISSFQPTRILKGTYYPFSKKTSLKNSLVVIQFCISIFLVVGTIVVMKQLNYIRNRELGFNREQILVLYVRDNNILQKYPLIKNAFLQNPTIIGVTKSNDLPITRGSTGEVFIESRDAGPEFEFEPYIIYVDHDFINVFGIDLISGRNFSREFANESQDSVIINETAAKMLGWKNPIGKLCGTWPAENGKVIGVIKDFHFHSLYSRIEPLILTCIPQMGRYISVKIDSVNYKMTIDFIKKTFREFGSTRPLEYFFLDDAFNNMYKAEQKLGSAFNYFSGLALFIACLGLFGLISYTAEMRTKEIGIRKVLGASASRIIFLLSRECTLNVFIANVIALPVAYYVASKWLENYAYRISVDIWVFLFPMVISFVVSLFTISIQSIKAATSNPVDSLRYE
ncbi:MAG: ABC transporter permease [Candidatus Aminicenantes bacterium]|nr:ABC transporter permease [Candidatus Aminicenantes bacterium]